ncbi:MAG: hypothetical protein ACREO5_06225 [Candidatus Binatia bacterium]
MLLRVDPTTRSATRVTGCPLKQFGLDERGLQDILFRSLDRLIGEDELLLLMQSRHWQEEPDLMALDRDGNLYIFEIKVWESRHENLLQALRYGQLNGALDYDGLNEIWQRISGSNRALKEAHQAKFGFILEPEQFNRRQVFVILTNGLDVDTRRAVKYWRTTGLQVRPWIYRSYALSDQMLLEIVPFRTADDPLEDQAESQGDNFYFVNTNLGNDPADDAAMLKEKKVAAYFEPWKLKIARLKRGDRVFLYRSGTGVVAVGKADGKLRKAAYHDNAEHKDEEYAMSLFEFALVKPPLSAAEVKTITSNPSLVFRQTMFSLDPDSGAKLYETARSRSALASGQVHKS